MLTSNDLSMMESDVIDTISCWGEYITIKIPKPISDQTNWDSRLHEFTGEILYNTFDNVPIERIDGFSMKQNLDVAGDRNDGSIILNIPIWYIKDKVKVPIDISDDMDIRIEYDSHIWRVKSMKRLIGEYLTNCIKELGD